MERHTPAPSPVALIQPEEPESVGANVIRASVVPSRVGTVHNGGIVVQRLSARIVLAPARVRPTG